MLGRVTPTDHLVDILFDPERTLAGRARVSKAPFTYLNRLRLKKHLQRQAGYAQTRERTFSVSSAGNGKKPWVQLLLFITVLAAVIGIRLTGMTGYLDPEKPRALIQSWGLLGPLFYMLIYNPGALALPARPAPLTIAGGILFGPVWGVVYTIIGATAGASLAFLVSRYIAGNWISANEKKTGCLLCFYSCPVGIVSNAQYTYGAIEKRNEVTMKGNKDILPADGTKVIVTLKLI
jgi:hypothetical protein